MPLVARGSSEGGRRWRVTSPMQRGTAKWLGLSVLFAGLMISTIFGSAVAAAPRTTYTITFTEVGLPTGTSWSVDFNSVTTTSNTTTISITGIAGGTYYY